MKPGVISRLTIAEEMPPEAAAEMFKAIRKVIG